jgi:hypothetical protein
MAALLIVANQYGLSPWTREIYAFPDKNNGIVPIVGVDGWARIINSHEKFDGMEFEIKEEGGKLVSCTCTIYRKDRSHPVRVTEYLAECYRETGPWKSHPSRMLRHKAMIQAARLAFGYVGIFDRDEAEAIVGAESGAVIDGETGEILSRKEEKPAQPALPAYGDEKIEKNAHSWAGKNPDRIIAMISSSFTLTDAQKERIRAAARTPRPEEPAAVSAENSDFVAAMGAPAF